MAFTSPVATYPNLNPVSLVGGRRRQHLAEFTLASDAVGTYSFPQVVPKGARILDIRLNASATLGASATLAIGITGTTGKYRAAATFTSADQWVSTALNAAIGVELTADEQIILTVAVAALPSSGRLLMEVVYVID
jgi:hypothetical protein